MLFSTGTVAAQVDKVTFYIQASPAYGVRARFSRRSVRTSCGGAGRPLPQSTVKPFSS